MDLEIVWSVLMRLLKKLRRVLSKNGITLLKKNQLLSEIISERLSEFYEYNYSSKFWNYLYSLNLLRYITILHNFFSKLEEKFKKEQFLVNETNLNEIKASCNFEQVNEFLNVQSEGKEFLLTIYYILFFKKNELRIAYNSSCPKEKNLSLRQSLVNAKKSILRAITNHSKIKVGILGAYFDRDDLSILKKKSGFKIQEIFLPSCTINSPRSASIRSKIFADFEGMDDFDKFFLECSKYIFPTDLMEDLNHKILIFSGYLERLQNLDYIVSEAWLGSTDINLFRAVASETKGTKTLYNEHNCFFHPYVGDLVEYQSNLVDQYLTMGWISKNPKFLSAGSLFPFKYKRTTTTKYKYLYVSYPIIETKTFYTSLYSNSDYSGYLHLLFVKKFFSLLGSQISAISYRGYPKDYNVKISILDKEYFLKDFLNQMKIVSSLKFKGPSCREQIASSELVIIDRPSTAYLEALHMNVPTICFFDPTTMFLQEEHASFFDDLIDAKIIHTTPSSAASHFKNVCNKINDWWLAEEVQTLKDRWLKRNFGNKDDLTNYLLKISTGVSYS